MKSLKQLYKEWKEKREFKSFIEQIEPGFNYFKNRYNPINHIEIYQSRENSNYIVTSYIYSNLKEEYHAYNKNEFSEYISKNNYHNYLERINHFDFVEFFDDKYNDKVDDSLNNITESIDAVRKNIEELKKQFKQKDKPKCYNVYKYPKDDLIEKGTLLKKDECVREYNMQDDDTFEYRQNHTYNADIYQFKDKKLYFTVVDGKTNNNLYTKDYMNDFLNVNVNKLTKDKGMEL